MRVKFHALEIEAHAEPMKGGYFLRCDHSAASGIGKGDLIEVNAANLEVQYVIAFPDTDQLPVLREEGRLRRTLIGDHMDKEPFGKPFEDLVLIVRAAMVSPSPDWIASIADQLQKLIPPPGGGAYEEGFRDGAQSVVDVLRSATE